VHPVAPCRRVRAVLDAAADGIPTGFPLPPVATTETPTSKEAVMAETWSGEFYCVKCKEKREAEGEVRVNDKGTRMAKAVCPVCGTNLNRILGKA
jgi:Zn finger protein HypA/HybF involved in hydrogenase expression